MNVYGIVWKLQIIPEVQSIRSNHTFKISVCYVQTIEGKRGFLRTPRTWFFTSDSINGFKTEKFGASQTRGIFGGVENVRQRVFSEVAERAIGDSLTVVLSEILARSENETRVEIFGPALPKIVGRFASLRPRSNVKICWVCPTIFPDWIAERANEVLVIPRYVSLDSSLDHESWEDEPLIVGYESEIGGIPMIIQHLQLWDKTEIDLPTSNWAEPEFVRAFLSREIRFSAAHIEKHIQPEKPYREEADEHYRHLTPLEEKRFALKSPKGQDLDQPRTAFPLGWGFDWID